jgi:hypothetical protein
MNQCFACGQNASSPVVFSKRGHPYCAPCLARVQNGTPKKEKGTMRSSLGHIVQILRGIPGMAYKH